VITIRVGILITTCISKVIAISFNIVITIHVCFVITKCISNVIAILLSYCCGFAEILNSQNFPKILPKVLAKLSAIFHLLPELFPCPQKSC